MAYRDELTKETLRVYQRYAIEVVERFGFCPWARAARESEGVALRVIFSTDPQDFVESLSCMDELSKLTKEVEVALVLYPLLDLDRLAFEDFGRRLRAVDDARRTEPAVFAMAAFHPSATADISHPDRLVPYVRRTPDPTLQLVRNSALSSIKGLDRGTAFVDVEALSALGLLELREPLRTKPVRERIAEQNLATLLDVGSDTVDAVLDDIRLDREAAHAQLLARFGERGPSYRSDP